nr:hypothetical protein [Mycobacterium decipiens]
MTPLTLNMSSDLTGGIIKAGQIEHLGIFAETCVSGSGRGARPVLGRKAARMPADGVVIACTSHRRVQLRQGAC